MSDVSNVGTPGENVPDSDDSTDWQKRYTDLQASFTKTSQEASDLRQYRQLVDDLQSDDPEAAAHAAEQLGLSFVNEELDSTNTNPQDILEQRLERIENWLGSQNEQETIERMQTEDAEYMDTALEGLETQLGRELTKNEVELLVGYALINRSDDGNPGIGDAITKYTDIDKSRQSNWVKSKRVSTPHEGQEGVETSDLHEGHAQRVAAMLQKYQANQSRT